MRPDPPASGHLDWTEAGPRSRVFDDIYFSADDGLAESRAVFLTGCGLPQAWSGRRRFVVGELGFGSGLNVAALLELWARTRPAEGQLHIFSIEGFPISSAEAARALSAWPELAAVATRLCARWPGQTPGVHRVEFPEYGAILDLVVGDVATALAGWNGEADAWFLDGFAPARNPAMWSDNVMAQVRAHAAPGARVATFTVAGAVRRGLTEAGFQVDKRPGFGRKRERLEGRLSGTPSDPPRPRVAIIGGGIAGAAAARAVRALGATAVVIEATAPGSGGSGNPAALVTPRLDAGLGEAARLWARAFDRAVSLYESTPNAVISRGVLLLAPDPRDAARHRTIAGSDLFAPGALEGLGAEQASARLGEPTGDAHRQSTALSVDPAAILQAWIGALVIADVAALAFDTGMWRLLDRAGGEILAAEVVILAGATGCAALSPGRALPLNPVRGQVSWTTGTLSEAVVAARGGYALPGPGGLLFGATHDRDDASTDLREADHARNRAALAAFLPGLAASLEGRQLEGRAATRAVTPDGMPLAGRLIPPGLHILAGLGSRGFSLAPLLAEHVVAQALGAPSPVPRPAAALVGPGRFATRAARRRGAS